MPKPVAKTPTVTLHLDTGPVTPAQQKAFLQFFRKLIAEASREAQAQQQAQDKAEK